MPEQGNPEVLGGEVEVKGQDRLVDETIHPVIQPTGKPVTDELNVSDMLRGVDIEDETPEEAHKTEHPTPDHPTGRIEP